MRAESKTRAGNNGRYLCLFCSRFEKQSGRKNPNARYQLDDGFFDEIDTEGKAYLLGWIASDGSITKGTVQLFVHRKDAAIVGQWTRILGCELPTKNVRDLVGITLSSTAISQSVCRWLNIVPGKKSYTVGFPALASNELTWAFVRGFFDGDGSVVAPTQSRGPRANITTNSARFRDGFKAWCPFKASYSADKIEFGGANALDFLGRLYDGSAYALPRKRDLYFDWCVWQPSLGGPTHHGNVASFRWVRSLPDAVPPAKARVSDSGYDLTVVRKVKQNGQVEFFDTGIKVQPDFGWYFDVVPRSSLSKSGYMMANSVGVIDRTYTGTIIIALMKVDKQAPDLELPARIAQMIPRQISHLQVVEVSELDETERGAGGFGSTGR